MGFFQLRRARIRKLVEGLVQRGRIEATENDAKDDAERHQDYGFAANPVDGEGLVLHIGGHTIILRQDRLRERPRLEAYEVSVWHKEGHHVTLKAGKLVECDCDTLVVNAATAVQLNTPSLVHNNVNIGSTHGHGGVKGGGEVSGPPVG